MENVVCSLKPGALITVKEGWHEEKDRKNTYEVEKIYPYHVLCRDVRYKFRRCFCIGDLIVMGLAKQEPKTEALKIGF